MDIRSNEYIKYLVSFIDSQGEHVLDDIDLKTKMITNKINNVGGKLYKYYDLHSEYTLKNIENDIVYLNSPAKFNDPFDCSLGLSIDELLMSSCILLLTENSFGLNDDQAEAFYKFVIGEELSSREIQFLNIEIDMYALDIAQKIEGWIHKPMTQKYNLFCRLLGLDDENRDYFYNSCLNFKMLQTNVSKAINDNFSITCFSETYTNQLMWSHYANKHTGICVEYDIGQLLSHNADDITTLLWLFPVVYSQSRPQIPVAVGRIDEFHYKYYEGQYALSDKIIALLTKSTVWNYENEWRLILPYNNRPLYRFPVISKIYAGVNISEADMSNLQLCAERKGVPIQKMHMSLDKYDFI